MATMLFLLLVSAPARSFAASKSGATCLDKEKPVAADVLQMQRATYLVGNNADIVKDV